MKLNKSASHRKIGERSKVMIPKVISSNCRPNPQAQIENERARDRLEREAASIIYPTAPFSSQLKGY